MKWAVSSICSLYIWKTSVYRKSPLLLTDGAEVTARDIVSDYDTKISRFIESMVAIIFK